METILLHFLGAGVVNTKKKLRKSIQKLWNSIDNQSKRKEKSKRRIEHQKTTNAKVTGNQQKINESQRTPLENLSKSINHQKA